MEDKKLLLKTLGELPPERRMNFLLLLSAVSVLAMVIVFFWKIINADQRDKVSDIRQQFSESKTEYNKRIREDSIKIEHLEQKVDSLTRAVYIIEKEMYENRLETINQKKLLIKRAKDFLKK